jgi:hypothetical protein
MVQRHKGGFVTALRLAAAIGLLGWSASASAQIITEYPIPTTASGPNGIVAGPDGALWFTEHQGNKIGRITVPVSTGPLLAAVLPSSRSVQVGNTATAFATIINSGSSPHRRAESMKCRCRGQQSATEISRRSLIIRMAATARIRQTVGLAAGDDP